MIITFFSNYLTHHQIPFCNEMSKINGIEFHFVSTVPMEQERISGGWGLCKEYAYELKSYENEETEKEAIRLARESDVIIIGSAPEKYVKIRMASPKKLTFRYSERIYKRGRWRVVSPRGFLIRCDTFYRYLGKPLYMLCASAYTAGDLALLGSYLGRCYKWGYFPETKRYNDIDYVIDKKKPASLLWVARLISWKHPEIPVELAYKLKTDGYDFTLDMIGVGERESEIKALIQERHLENHVFLLGSMPPEQVREHMENTKIFLFTSDRNEGWGAVLNEAMNSGCAVVSNNKIGSAPFLLEDGVNGFLYNDGNIDELYRKTKLLLDEDETRKNIGKNAYKTITEDWNAEIAAHRLVLICERLLKGEKGFFDEGICSKALLM